ncbi:MAG TPA: quinol:cytochrome C oxidoreductase [bacterium]|mgnify:FL=1|nr:quinol:cytochrome C oxidoreductase [Candidatus Omnitrophota bacterium]HOL95263.1 quinol:cytochrome C oxidoreductase [bacterium]HPP00688.1 quinol:cytochrome C oxidoreductase [bacterium]HXK92082.1 quinol:cytochrome C oxidoreductase [bacterium]
MHLTDPTQIFEERRHLERLGLRTTQWAGGAGLALLAGTFLMCLFLEDGRSRFFHSYLTSYAFYVSLSLGALFFVALHHISRAGWSVVVRRLAELMGANTLLLAVLFLPILAGLEPLYPWSQTGAAHADPLLAWKSPYLNVVFFLARSLFYFAVWTGLSYYLLSRSLEQDTSGHVELTLRLERISAPALLLLGMTVTFAAFDWLMSLDAHWYSTIFGVYYFSGGMLGFFAFLTLVVYALQRAGRLTRAITVEHYHDLGKWLLAFTLFWAYIAFSQYMLMWYANLPEETGWFLRRQSGGWGWVGLILIFGHFIIPFFGLLSRYPKRRKPLLAFWAGWILVMHWIDLYWLVMPEFSPDSVPLNGVDFGCLAGLGGLYLANLARLARGRSLVPVKDPRLGESLTFENA